MKLPRKITLNQRSDFKEVREKGRSASGRFLVLGMLDKPEIEGFRYALITTKKAGKAHERNRIRRLIRSALIEEGYLIQKSCHLVFIARWKAKNATQSQIKQDVQLLCKKLSVMKKDTNEAKS